MKRKTIKAVLRKKIRAWIDSIAKRDENLANLVKRDAIVTGGSIASMLLNEPVNDYDIYFRTKDTCMKVAMFYVTWFLENAPKSMRDKTGVPIPIIVTDRKPIWNDDKKSMQVSSAAPATDRVRIIVKSAGVIGDGSEDPYRYYEHDDPDNDQGDAFVAQAYGSETTTNLGEIEEAYDDMEKAALETTDPAEPFRPVFMSTNAITLADKIQLVVRFYGEPDEIHANYDFVHCTNWWTPSNGHLELKQAALEALLAKELRYVGSKYPLCSLFRIRKFVRRGWQINAGMILKIAMQLNDLDLKDIETLEDQLTGVDVAYFHEVLDKLRAKDETKVDSAYLVSIIDRMF